jgi:hypothetical protein
MNRHSANDSNIPNEGKGRNKEGINSKKYFKIKINAFFALILMVDLSHEKKRNRNSKPVY